MSCSQDSAFCVPVYSNAESACQAQDQINGKQEYANDEQVPTFFPGWRDQAHVKTEQTGSKVCTAGSGESTLSRVNSIDKRVASAAQPACVSTRTPQVLFHCPPAPLSLPPELCSTASASPDALLAVQGRDADGTSTVVCSQAERDIDVSCVGILACQQHRLHSDAARSLRSESPAGLQGLQWRFR